MEEENFKSEVNNYYKEVIEPQLAKPQDYKKPDPYWVKRAIPTSPNTIGWKVFNLGIYGHNYKKFLKIFRYES